MERERQIGRQFNGDEDERWGRERGYFGRGREQERDDWREREWRERNRDWRETEPYRTERESRSMREMAGEYRGHGGMLGGYYGWQRPSGMQGGYGMYGEQRPEERGYYGRRYGYERGEQRPLFAYGMEHERGRFEDRSRFGEEEEPGLMERIGGGIKRFFGSERGPHYGKGPKGYRRSDERIREDVCDRIATFGWIDASEVEVNVREGEVNLTGTVQNRRDKRMLDELIEDVPGVQDVHNQLRVRREALQRTTTTGERIEARGRS